MRTMCAAWKVPLCSLPGSRWGRAPPLLAGTRDDLALRDLRGRGDGGLPEVVAGPDQLLRRRAVDLPGEGRHQQLELAHLELAAQVVLDRGTGQAQRRIALHTYVRVPVDDADLLAGVVVPHRGDDAVDVVTHPEDGPDSDTHV